MSKNKKILIKRLFSHLEGIVVIPTFLVLNKFGIIKKIKSQKNISLSLLSNEESIQTGYLNVALTTLSSLNILKKTIDQNNVYYNLTEYGSEYIKSTEDYLFYSKIQTLINKNCLYPNQ